MTTSVTAEPRIYGPANPDHSYFRDLTTLHQGPGAAGYNAAELRMSRHRKEIGAEVAAGSAEGRRAALASVRRDAPISEQRAEVRAMTSGSSSGGAFVAPNYMTSQWAAFRSQYRAFIDQCTEIPLPEYGLTVNVPSFTSTSGIGTQSSENAALTETDPGGAILTSNLTTIGGAVTFSQPLMDRGGADGLTFDTILSAQLKQQLDAALDVYTINQAVASPGTITQNSAWTTTNFYSDIASAKELLQDTAGTRFRATHIFSTADVFEHAAAQMGNDLRPVFMPLSIPGWMMQDGPDKKIESWTGHVLPGGIAWYVDNNIPAISSNTQVIVARPVETLVCEGPATPAVHFETLANQLSVVFTLRSYATVVARFPKSVSIITGNGYPTTMK